MNDKETQRPETPIIIIERDREQTPRKKPTRRPWIFLATAVALLLLLIAGYKLHGYYFAIGVPISVSPSENISKLETPAKQETPEVIMTSDTVLGVPLRFYSIHGLRASIEFEEPDTADASVFLYCRSADHKPDSTYIGSLVAQGKELCTDRSRLGYMAMTKTNMVIGISRSDDVKDYALAQGGSFFRQYILVSDGVIPTRFHLHGKVERRAIGRMGDTLYYIATQDKETLWGFADALREYGFIDAIYITGGTDYSFYRAADGQRRDIGSPTQYPHKKWKGVIPWLVFRK